jgi:magnesium chelatase subunit I
MMEFVLFGLAEHSLIGKNNLERGIQFKDILGSMFSEKDFFGDENGN